MKGHLRERNFVATLGMDPPCFFTNGGRHFSKGSTLFLEMAGATLAKDPPAFLATAAATLAKDPPTFFSNGGCHFSKGCTYFLGCVGRHFHYGYLSCGGRRWFYLSERDKNMSVFALLV